MAPSKVTATRRGQLSGAGQWPKVATESTPKNEIPCSLRHLSINAYFSSEMVEVASSAFIWGCIYLTPRLST